jgi:hypothetical protein
LFARRARDSFNSTNLLERLTLPSMAYAPDEKLEVYAQATRGLLQLESDPERRLKYLDFIDIYADLTENERMLYNQRYPQEAADMSGFAQRFIDQGIEQGIETGVQRGEARVLLALLKIRFGDLPDSVRQRVENADAESLLIWSTRVLTAQTIDEVFGDGP